MTFIIKQSVRYVLYPVLLGLTVAVAAGAILHGWNYSTVYGLTTLATVVTLALVERVMTFERKWAMTGKSFLRDLKYIAIDAPSIALVKTVFGIWAIRYSQHHRDLLGHKPLWLEVVFFLLVFEFIQYWYHRLSHEAPGRAGRFLWRVHLAHHLPDQVYVVMHAVFNPVNALITAAIIQTPLILLGVSPEGALVATLLIDLQSLVSHFNVDLRAGYFNYIFIGTETHRYHHAADPKVSGNYGNTLAIWDILFGTFVYRPGVAPERLGVYDQAAYPDSNDLIGVITLPFRA
jgi:sterol desaturase/sphingolipid hydroxylase (fatty acid hydroxylase superfamily)